MKSVLKLYWMGLVVVLGLGFGLAMGQEKVEPKRIGLWGGRAALGDPLPQIVDEVATLAARVDGHLTKMGFSS